jgi:hypothetical protein
LDAITIVIPITHTDYPDGPVVGTPLSS